METHEPFEVIPYGEAIRAPAAVSTLMTQEELNAILKRNPQIRAVDLTTGCKVQDTKPEPDPAPALESVAKGKETCLGRAQVRFVMYRVRLLDPDNAAGSVKDLLDGLSAAGIIADDSPDKITLQTEQVKVRKRTEERTEIEIRYE